MGDTREVAVTSMDTVGVVMAEGDLGEVDGDRDGKDGEGRFVAEGDTVLLTVPVASDEEVGEGV